MVDPGGDKLGTIDAIYLDDVTGQPEWVTVNTGLFGTRPAFVPLAGAERTGDQRPGALRQGPGQGRAHIDADGAPVPGRGGRLYRHYGLDYSEHRSARAARHGDGDDGRPRHGRP